VKNWRKRRTFCKAVELVLATGRPQPLIFRKIKAWLCPGFTDYKPDGTEGLIGPPRGQTREILV
jgi:hypothetical protein